jgi:hypothetical protein
MSKLILLFALISISGFVSCNGINNGIFGTINNIPAIPEYNQFPINNFQGGDIEQDIDINTNGHREHIHRSCHNGICQVSKGTTIEQKFFLVVLLVTVLARMI